MATNYIVATRNQFTFTSDDLTIARILTQNVASNASIDVNVVALIIKRIDINISLIKIIVGTDDPQSPGNEAQNQRFREILRSNNLEFTERPVIQLFNIEAITGTPGAYRIIYIALICSNIPVLSSYYGEPVTGFTINTFFEVPSDLLCKAVRIIRNFDGTNPEAQLCINRNNVLIL